MKFFCKGFTCGLITGMITGSIIVAKNKNLANKIKDKTEMAEKEIYKFASKIKQVFSQNENKKKEDNKNDENVNNVTNKNGCLCGENNFMVNKNEQGCSCYNNG